MQNLPKTLALAALLGVAGTTSAQESEQTLLYTVRGDGYHATLSGSSGTAFEQVDYMDVAAVTVAPGASAEQFLNKAAFNVLHGDKNCDAEYVQADLGFRLDALLVCPDTLEPSIRQTYISVREPIGTSGSTAMLLPGDVATPRPDGGYDYFITEAQIRSVFGIAAGDSANVDAIARADDGSIFLSLEHDVPVLGGLFAQDGDLLMIPGSALIYDGCRVADTFAMSGLIVADESIFDGLVSHAFVSDTDGVQVTTITDLDGLEIDPRGGVWPAQGPSGAFVLPNLIFVGRDLEGGSVLSTAFNGSLAQINGHPMGDHPPVPTDGLRVGLLKGSLDHVWELNALALLDTGDPLRVLTHAKPPLPMPGMPIKVEWSGADPLSPVMLVASIGASVACGNVPGVPTPLAGFGYWFGNPTSKFLGPLPSDALGFGSFTTPYPMGVPAGLWLTMQTITKQGGRTVVGGAAVMQF